MNRLIGFCAILFLTMVFSSCASHAPLYMNAGISKDKIEIRFVLRLWGDIWYSIQLLKEDGKECDEYAVKSLRGSLRIFYNTKEVKEIKIDSKVKPFNTMSESASHDFRKAAYIFCIAYMGQEKKTFDYQVINDVWYDLELEIESNGKTEQYTRVGVMVDEDWEGLSSFQTKRKLKRK